MKGSEQISKQQPLARVILLALTLSSGASFADSVLEEIVVTAQKREQSAQDVGISITAFTGEQMKAFGVEQSIDIATFSPGVHISGNLAGQNTQFSIRGVTQNDFNDIIEAPNAVYLDEGYLAIAQAQTFAVFDIDRVEILKGPQGTLFGRNATGGLIHYISTKPNLDEAGGYLDVTYGSYDTDADANRYTVEAAYGVPLSDIAAARLAIKYNRQEPYLKNLYPQSAFGGSPGSGAGADLGDDDTFTARGSLLIKPSDQLQINLSVNYADSEVGTGPYQSKSTIAVVDSAGELINVIDTPAGETRLSIQGTGDAGGNVFDGSAFIPGGGIGLAGRSVPGGDFFGYLDPDGDDFTFSSDFAFKDQGTIETLGFNGRIEYDLDSGMVFTSVTDYKNYEKLLFIDVDSGPANQLANYAGVDATSFTQEFRFSGETDKTRWVAGFFFLHIETDSDNGLKAPVNSIVNGLDIGVVAELQTDSTSLFGQIEYDITPNLTAILGGRFISEKKEFDVAIGIFPSFDNFTVNRGGFIPNIFGAGSPFRFNDETSDTFFTGKAQLDWRVNDDLLIYGGVNRGVKAGSFNAPLLGAYLGSGGDAGLPYDEEVLLSYEGGFKVSFADNRARLNGSIYYYDYSDYQAFLFVGVGGVVVNLDANTVGLELELQATLAEGLDTILSFSWFDAEVEDLLLRNGSPLPPRDVDPAYAPEIQATAMLRYEWEALGGMLSVQGDVTYSDEYFYNLRNFDADKFDSYILANAKIGWRNSSDNWEVNLAIRNITDDRAGIQGFDLATLCGCNEVSYRAPRNYALSARYRF